MKTRMMIVTLLLAGVVSSPLAPRAFAKSEKENTSELRAKAKVTEEQARSIALAKVPQGTIKEADIETEKGRLIWSFDVATPGSTDITEVQIDANTAELVAVTTESAKDEAREAKSEHKGKHKHAKDEKDDDEEDGDKSK